MTHIASLHQLTISDQTETGQFRDFASRADGKLRLRSNGGTEVLFIEPKRSRFGKLLARFTDRDGAAERKAARTRLAGLLWEIEGTGGGRVVKTSTQLVAAIDQGRRFCPETYETTEQYAHGRVRGAGGVTGSKAVEIGNDTYQVKGSIQDAKLPRRVKAGGLNTEVFAETIGSNIARAAVGKGREHLFPEVLLVQNMDEHRVGLRSKWLSEGKGDLDKFHDRVRTEQRGSAGERVPGHKHVVVALSGELEPGVHLLHGDGADDMARNLVVSAFVGDHDVNPGNMVAVAKEKDDRTIANPSQARVGRIDFGHAFNDLIAGPCGGGGVQDQSGNRILDFFNRETVSGNPFVSGSQTPKLWRDYKGLVPTKRLVDALTEIGNSENYKQGLQLAKQQLRDLVIDLEREGTPEAKKQLVEIRDSLAKLSKNIGKPATAPTAREMVELVLGNVDSFMEQGRKDMLQVAKLCQLQCDVDAYIAKLNGKSETEADMNKLVADCRKLENGGEGVRRTWMKLGADEPAFQGTLSEYIAYRRDQLAGASKLQPNKRA